MSHAILQAGSVEEYTKRLEARKAFFSKLQPEGYAAEWAELLSAVPIEDERLASVLEFRIAGRMMALPSRWVKAISPKLTVCPVPHREGTAFLGLVAFGGDVIPCCSLARILGIADAAVGVDARTVVLEEKPGDRWAFHVDAVVGVGTRRAEASAPEIEAGMRVPSEWVETSFLDDRGTAVQLLKPEVLFARLGRATA